MSCVKKEWLGNLLLITAALIWGCAFVAQSIGMDYVEPFTFTAVRSILGALALLPCIAVFDHINKKKGKAVAKVDGKLLKAGVISGLLLAGAVNLQQVGIMYTSAGKAGFITALYIVLVPISGIFLRKKISGSVWLSVALATGGLYLLCINESLTINNGDILVFLCAFIFAAQILVVDHYAPMVDGVKMAFLQFFVCGIVSLVPMLIWESPNLNNILAAWQPICYTAFMSTSIAYTFQIIGQKYTEPTIASLLMSFEAVFATVAGFIILNEVMTSREFLGCVIMFSALILAQVPVKGMGREKVRKKEKNAVIQR